MKTISVRLTFVTSVRVNQEMASNDFILSSGSDTEVSEMEDYELEVEGSPNSSFAASDEEDTHEAYADDFIPFQPPDQIISESVGVVLLFEVLRAHRRMLGGFPMSTFRFNKIDPLLPSLLLFAFTFTVKRYGMKQYPFLFASNIATTENNTFLRHGFTSDGSHNLRNSQSGFYVTNYTRPISFRQAHQLGNGFSNLAFPPL